MNSMPPETGSTMVACVKRANALGDQERLDASFYFIIAYTETPGRGR